MHTGSAPHILIFEPEPHGHTREWLAHLHRFAEQERPDWRVTFAVAPELTPELSSSAHINVISLDERESRLCLHPSTIVSGFCRWRSFRRHMKKSGAGHGLVLCLDHLSLPFALGFGVGLKRKSISGILFRPSTHYRELDPDDVPTFKERLRDFRKRILYALMLRNTDIYKVLSLDPYFPHHAEKIFAYGKKVGALVDPAFPPPMQSKSVDDIPEGRQVFLLFGALAARKGMLTLLAALRKLDAGTADGIAVIIAGRVEPDISTLVNEAAAMLRRDQPRLWLKIDDRRLPVSYLSALVRRSDVILAPYQRFVGSSGVLLWAAKAGKPVITQNYGLLGKLCREHNLGLSLDTTDPTRLSAAIESMARGVSESFDQSRAAAFVDSQTPRHFAATLFGAIPDAHEVLRVTENAPSFRPRTGHVSPFR